MSRTADCTCSRNWVDAALEDTVKTDSFAMHLEIAENKTHLPSDPAP